MINPRPPDDFAAFALFLLQKRTRRGTRLKEATIEGKLRAVKKLSRRVPLEDVEVVDEYIRSAGWTEGYKQNVAQAYKDWCEFNGIEYRAPVFRVVRKLPYVPLEKDIDQLIGYFRNSKYAALLQLLKETGMRPGEAFQLAAKDFDLERQTVTVNNPEKGSRPRQFKMSNKLTAMMTRLLKDVRMGDRVWSAKPKSIMRRFQRIRERAAKDLSNPNLLRINLKAFRHFKATQEYHRTKDILYVQRILGHKNIQNTLIYTHLINFKTDEYTCKVATTIDEATELVEAGFDFVTQFEGKMIFRKRK